jgi:hypothetical protein
VPPTATPTSTATGVYGAAINADDLANAIVGLAPNNGSCNRTLAIRFRATHSGTLQAIRPFFIWSSTKPGYASGNGGNIQIEVQTDNGSTNHLPSGNSLASLEYDAPVTQGNHYPLLTFSSPAQLTAGQLYHLVFSDVAADPSENWVSLDNLFMWETNSPAQPTISDTDLALLEYGGLYCTEGWEPYARGGGTYTPVIEMDYSDGFSQGQGYIQGYDQPDGSWNPKVITGASAVREAFTVSGSNRTATSVAVRVNRISGNSPLTIRLEQANGTLVTQGTVQVPEGLVDKTHDGSSWVTVPFSTPVTLHVGTAYNLVLTSPADTTLTTHALEEGSQYGYSPTTYFGDGYAEYNDGTGWQIWNLWGIPNTLQADLQFYFVTG